MRRVKYILVYSYTCVYLQRKPGRIDFHLLNRSSTIASLTCTIFSLDRNEQYRVEGEKIVFIVSFSPNRGRRPYRSAVQNRFFENIIVRNNSVFKSKCDASPDKSVCVLENRRTGETGRFKRDRRRDRPLENR